jgi:tight adherence protein C
VSIVDTVTSPTNLVAAAVAILCFATIVTLSQPLLKRDNLDARLKSVAVRREELRRRSREAMNRGQAQQSPISALRRSDEGMYKRVVERLQLRRLLEDPQVADKLAQAGFRGPKPITTFYFFRFVTPFVLSAIVLFYLFVINDFGVPTLSRLCFGFMGFVAGFYAPSIYIKNVAQKRRESIVLAFPDALDLLLICVESGMSIEAAILKVSEEVGSSSIELAEEMNLLTAELSYLPDRRLAYEGLARRTNHPGIKSVATAMIQAERYGTPLGTALRVMAKENRELRMSAAEKKAAALPAKLTVPMIVFFLPVLFMVIIGPAAIRIIDQMKSG